MPSSWLPDFCSSPISCRVTSSEASDVTGPSARERTTARERLAVAAGAALLGAGLIFVMFILPAEFAVDPLGVGARLGLLQLGVTGQEVRALTADAGKGATQAPIIVAQERGFHEETVEFTIAAHQFMEYKYRLDKGKALLYSWKSTSPVNYELHAEPDGAPRGYAESYEKGQATAEASG